MNTDLSAFLAERASIEREMRQRGMESSGPRWVRDVRLHAEYTRRAIRACFARFEEAASNLEEPALSEFWKSVRGLLSPLVSQHSRSYAGALEQRACASGSGSNSLALALLGESGQTASNLRKLIEDLVRQQISTRGLKGPGRRPTAPVYNVGGDYIHGDKHVGDKFINTNATMIGVVQGSDNAIVTTGHVQLEAAPQTQAEYRQQLAELQAILVRSQDAIDQLGQGVYEALHQFLRVARDIQVERTSVVQVQAMMKDALDDIWVKEMAKGMKPSLLPKSLELIIAFLKNPLTQAVAKKLIGAG